MESLETVLGGLPGAGFDPEVATGVFFAEQTADSLAGAIRFFESARKGFSAERIRQNALRFDAGRFQTEMRAFIEAKLLDFQSKGGDQVSLKTVVI
jgi:hypothetical protein